MSCGTRTRVPSGRSRRCSIPPFFPSGSITYLTAVTDCTAYCWWPLPAPPSAASPVARPASALAWNPTAEPPGARARSRRLHRGTLTRLHCGYCELYLYCTYRTATAVLLAAAPDHCGPPGPVTSPVAVLQPPWLRNSVTAPSCTCTCGYCSRQFVSAGPCSISATGETIATPLPNVYSGQHRFSGARQRGNPPFRGRRYRR